MPSLTVDHATKRYGALTAVDHVSFSAQPGRILGLLGPNGAGKTSTIRMITYITVPDEGRILFGEKPVGPWSQERMGYLPEERGLYKKLRVGKQLVYLGALKGLPPSEAGRRARYWLDRFDARDYAGKKTEELSKGMQQKIQFIATILHQPELLILDEPFSGLDPINTGLLKEIIVEMKNEGRTILFASHQMEQVEQICDDICLISRGQILLQGPLRDIKSRFGKNTIVLEFEGDSGFLTEMEREGLLRVVSRTNNRAQLQLVQNTSAVRKRVLQTAIERTTEVFRYDLVEPPLSEIFIDVVTRKQHTNGTPEPAERPVVR